MSRISSVAFTSFLLTAAAISLQPLLAAEGDEGRETKATLSEKFEVHGYVSLAYAKSDGHQVFGIPDSGTTQLSTAALQIRYTPTDKDEFILQFDHEHFGESPVNDLHDELGIDWLYYQRNFTDATSISIGRIPLPIGIYNKIRDVGTLLPFYRPSAGFYGEGTFTAETVDGLVFSHRFAHNSPWSLDADLYYGDWERVETDLSTFGTAQANGALGVQFWLNTPLSGLRFGVGANRYDTSGGPLNRFAASFGPALPVGPELRNEMLNFSLDGNFSRVVLRTEYQNVKISVASWKAYYAELALSVTGKLRLMAMYDRKQGHLSIPFFGTFTPEILKDYILGVSYRFRHNVVVKLEHHWYQGYVEDQRINFLIVEPPSVNYAILSASAHF